ncbi:MAG: hypothetical protein IMW89_00355 [Ktedonobacteraceae bacterium]|nr:hypothetical protein [Ktedonobacteraceae bacterium]
MQKNKMLTHTASSQLNSDFWKYWSGQTISNFGNSITLFALMIMGLLNIALAFTPWLWLALIIQGCTAGLGILFNINTASLRQSIVPDHMLGRVMSIAGVLACSAIPLGAVAGGYAVAWTQSIVLVYAVIGVLNFLIPLGFSFSALGRAEEYLPKSVNSESHSYSPRSRRA